MSADGGEYAELVGAGVDGELVAKAAGDGGVGDKLTLKLRRVADIVYTLLKISAKTGPAVPALMIT